MQELAISIYMIDKDLLDTHQKALSLNLDTTIYGSLVEIGAGQEVAAQLFRAGGAAGTIAKTMSAYDMKVSDEIYGKAERYVSKERLTRMVDREYELLEQRLRGLRDVKSRFFSFANTVSARNYRGTNICHGWLGVRFQTEYTSETSCICIHVNMLDETNLRQQQALGILGINLIYASYFYLDDHKRLMKSLFDQLNLDRIEVDFIEVSGPAFGSVDLVELNLSLVRYGLCHAVMFSPEIQPVAPMDLLYKRPVLMERGGFHTSRKKYSTMLEKSRKRICQESEGCKREPVAFFEMTINDDEKDDLKERLYYLAEFEMSIMVSSYVKNYELTGYLSRYTQEGIRFAQSLGNWLRTMQENYYDELDCGILSAMSLLLARDVKIYVFGMEVEELKAMLEYHSCDLSDWDFPESGFATLQNLTPRSHVRHLFAYLLETESLVSMEL